MKSRFLFPRWCLILGIVLFVFGVSAAFIVYTSSSYYNSINDINKMGDVDKVIDAYSGCVPAIIIGLLLIAFSKEKIEDEQIAQLRLDSLQWAVYINYCVLVICFFLIHGIGVLSVVALSVLTPIVFFIIRFRWKIYQLNQLFKKEIAS